MIFRSKSQSGLGHVILVALVALVIGVIGYAGWRVVDNRNNSSSEVDSTASSAPVAVPDREINNNSDLDSAKAFLTQTDLDEDLNPNSFDSDVEKLL